MLKTTFAIGAFALSLCATSAAMAGSCQFYDGANFTGDEGIVPGGMLVKWLPKGSEILRQYDAPHDETWRNRVSSIKLDPGCLAIVWGEGIHGHHTYRQSVADMGTNNDATYAGKCECN